MELRKKKRDKTVVSNLNAELREGLSIQTSTRFL
jgi:hypothetical protein